MASLTVDNRSRERFSGISLLRFNAYRPGPLMMSGFPF